MRWSVILLLGLLPNTLFSQPVNQQTQGEQSPAVVAENIRITYGVPPNITLEIIEVYNNQYTSAKERNDAVKALIRKYKSLDNPSDALNRSQQKSLGLKPNSPLVNIFNYDLFMSTRGNQSPAIYAPGGSAEVWYGIPPEAFKGIWNVLEEKQLALEDFDKKFQEQIKKFKELKRELDARAGYDRIAAKAKVKLEQGDLDGAERILEKDVRRANKQSAFRNYELAQVKVLNGKPREAGEYFLLAALLDKENPTYTFAYGQYLTDAGDYRKAIEQLQLSLEGLSDSLAQGQEAARRYNKVGESYLAINEHDQAINYLERAQNILLGLGAEAYSGVADCYNNLGLAYVAKGEFNRGIDYYQQALEIYQEKQETFFPEIAITFSNMGSAYAYKRDFSQALEYYEFSHKVLSDIYGPDHPRVATSLNNIGFAYGNMQEYDRALEYYQQALKILNNTYGEDHPNFARTYGNIGVAYAYKQEYDRALEYYRKVLRIDQKLFGETHADVADDYTNIGQAYLSKKDFIAAADYFKKAMDIDLRIYGKHHLRIARDYGNLGMTYLEQQAYDQAVEAYQQFIETYRHLSSGNPQELVTAYNNLAAAYVKKKELPKAIDTLEKAKSIVREFFPPEYAPAYIQRFDRDIRYLRDQME